MLSPVLLLVVCRWITPKSLGYFLRPIDRPQAGSEFRPRPQCDLLVVLVPVLRRPHFFSQWRKGFHFPNLSFNSAVAGVRGVSGLRIVTCHPSLIHDHLTSFLCPVALVTRCQLVCPTLIHRHRLNNFDSTPPNVPQNETMTF